MKATDVRVPLFLTILIMSSAPLIAAFYLLDHSLRTSLNLGFNPQVVRVLDQASNNLRALGKLDANNRGTYRAQFDELQDLRHVYDNPKLIRTSIEDSIKIYFGLGFIGAVLLAVVAASLLSRRIARSYRLTYEELTRQREKVRYLQEMSSWQDLARMLAHEIKNPLTPIEVLVSSLSRSYLQKAEPEFREQLAQTQRMIGEELDHLKNTVNRFGEFARLPQVEAVEQNVATVLAHHLETLAINMEGAEIQFHPDTTNARAKVDSTLLRQVLSNIVRNGMEANPGRRIRFDIGMTSDAARIEIAIANDGVPVPAEIAPRIFDPYVSTKTGQNNMGLGLAIVKKIVIEHGGDVAYREAAGRPCFIVTLPRVT
jgi:signal transduction histidine kinase